MGIQGKEARLDWEEPEKVSQLGLEWWVGAEADQRGNSSLKKVSRMGFSLSFYYIFLFPTIPNYLMFPKHTLFSHAFSKVMQ